MVQLVIDTKKIEAQEGTTVLEAARQAGITIPTLCYMKALRPNQACRLCVVEAKGPAFAATVTTSCDLMVAEGMEIVTNSPKIKQMRATVAELLLASMPGNTAVQEVASQLGVTGSRYAVPKGDNCVLCGICIQACSMKIGEAALSFGTSSRCTPKVAEFVSLDSDRCVGCGTCANVCPVGAITVNDHDGQRDLTLYGQTVATHELVACQSCGAQFTTRKAFAHVTDRLKKDNLAIDSVYCPICAREKNPAPLFEQAAL